MKRFFLSALFILCTSLAFAEQPVKVGDTEVTFIPPDGFQPLTQAVMDIKWPSNTAPRFAVGNESASTTVAYDIKPNALPEENLPDAQKAFTQVFERMIAGLVWKKNEIIELAGQKWVLMEMTSNAIDTDIYNIMLVTGYDGRMLVFNFNSTKKEFPKLETALRDSLNSIKIPR